MKVLVIEDDESIREGLCELLEYAGFSAAGAPDGAQGLSWLHDHAHEACVVLLDLMMPVMDGFEFLKFKDEAPALASLPVIVVTAAGPIVEKSLRLKHRVQACLSKPLRFDLLLDAISACCPPGRAN